MGRDVKGNGWAIVPKLPLDVFDVLSLVDHEAGVSMTQIVKPNLGKVYGLPIFSTLRELER